MKKIMYLLAGAGIGMCLLLCTISKTSAQSIVSGTVLSAEDGSPLPGATVRIDGGTLGTNTDDNGQFVLSAPGSNVNLSVTSLGYLPLDTSLRLPLTAPLIISLRSNSSMLDETVVIGYGETSRRFNTGSVSKISAEEIEKQPVTNVLSALAGRAPGVFVRTSNGLPGGNISVQIRGQGSIAAGTDPLYVIDGVPFTSTPLNANNANYQNINGLVSPLNSIAPSDIASIEILKDADATAIYGSRGANGVVLITTKKGSAGKTTVNFNIYNGISKAVRLPNMLGITDYLQMRREAFANDGVEPTRATAPDLLVWDQDASTDWSEYLLGGTAHATNAQASISGGRNNTRFSLRFNYRKEGTVLPGDQHYQRGGGHLTLAHTTPDNRFHMQFIGNYTADRNNHIKSIDFAGLYELPPNYPVYLEDGSYNWTRNNPEAWLKQESRSGTENFISHALFRYTLFKGLNLKAGVGYTKINMDMYASEPTSSKDPASNPVSEAHFGQNYTETVLAEPQLEYKTSIARNAVTVLVGGTWQRTISEGSTITGTDYSNDALLESLGAAGRTIFARNNSSEYKYASVFGRITINNRRKYLLNISFRRDGSSRFGPGRQFGNFGAIGAGWVFSEEPFINKSFPFLSFGKLRASYGIVGNDQIGEYSYLSTYRSSYRYQGMATLTPSNVANALFGWESTKKIEGAVELGFLKDRIMLTVAYFHNRSDNQLISYKIPYISGPFGGYQANFPGVVENKGWEFSLAALNIQQAALRWKTTFNMTIPENRLAAFPNMAGSSYANTYEIGKDLSIIKGYQFTGIDPESGVAQFKDINQDGNLTFADDRVSIGKSSPDLFGGISNSLIFKFFQLDFFLQYVKQQCRINTLSFHANSIRNVLEYAYENRWRKPGDEARIQRSTATPGTDAWRTLWNMRGSSASMVDGSFIRLNNISFRYNLPGAFLEKLNLSHCSLYVQGQNLLTITMGNELDGIDPETTSHRSSVPLMRSYVAGIQLTL